MGQQFVRLIFLDFEIDTQIDTFPEGKVVLTKPNYICFWFDLIVASIKVFGL